MKKALSIIMLLAMLLGTFGGISVTAEETGVEATAQEATTETTEETTPKLSIDYYNLSFRDNVCIKY